MSNGVRALRGALNRELAALMGETEYIWRNPKYMAAVAQLELLLLPGQTLRLLPLSAPNIKKVAHPERRE